MDNLLNIQYLSVAFNFGKRLGSPCLAAMLLWSGEYVFAQNTISATWSSGMIPSSYNMYDPVCNGPAATLTITLPPGDMYQITDVETEYTIQALNGGWMSDQRSKIKCVYTGLEEEEVAGEGNQGGYLGYVRSIAEGAGVFAGGTQLRFELWMHRTWQGQAGCNTEINRVPNNGWTMLVHFSNEITSPRVGVNETIPEATLDVGGAIKIGSDVSAPEAGTIRWNESSQDFEGYTGSAWLSLTKNTEGGGWGHLPTFPSQELNGDAVAGSKYGSAIALSGNYAIVGAPFNDVGLNQWQGSASILFNEGSGWKTQAYLNAPDGAAHDRFGSSVALYGDYAIVGAPFKNSPLSDAGKVYIFFRNGTTWSLQVSFTASDVAVDDNFGTSVSISGEYAVIGAPGHNTGGQSDRGKSYVFKRTSTVWSQQAMLTASDGVANDNFGKSVSISGDYVISGAPHHSTNGDSFRGKAYIHLRTGTTWTEQAMLIADDGEQGSFFGQTVAIDESYAVVSAINHDIQNLAHVGKAYVFFRSGTTWTQQSHLVAGDISEGDYFGSSIALHGAYVVIGAPSNYDYGGGKAYVFKRSGTQWSQNAKLASHDLGRNDIFGTGVGIYGNYIIVGAPGHETNYGERGKIYYYERE